MSPNTLPSCGELERELSQNIRALYRQRIGHQPSKVVCHLFAERLVFIVEDSLSVVEQFLAENSLDSFVEQLRNNLDEAIKPHIITLTESILSVSVIDLVLCTTLEKRYTAAIATLNGTPKVRNPEVIPKRKNWRK